MNYWDLLIEDLQEYILQLKYKNVFKTVLSELINNHNSDSDSDSDSDDDYPGTLSRPISPPDWMFNSDNEEQALSDSDDD